MKNHNEKSMFKISTKKQMKKIQDLYPIAQAISYPQLHDNVIGGNCIVQLYRIYNHEPGVKFGNAKIHTLSEEERKVYDSLNETEVEEFVCSLADQHFGIIDKARSEFFTRMTQVKLLLGDAFKFSREEFNEILKRKPETVSRQEAEDCFYTPTKLARRDRRRLTK